MFPSSHGPNLFKRLPAAALAIALMSTGLAMAAASSASASPTIVIPVTARVKCVNGAGVARYAPSGRCNRGEHVERISCAAGGHCVVGDTGPGRGKVFYAGRRAAPWGRYLEAAPPNWHAGGDQNLAWCDNSTDVIPGTNATGLGDGLANSNAMMSVCRSGAANAARAYHGAGKTDWYLASRDELRQLYLHESVSTGFQLHGYWTSSQVSNHEAWIQDFYVDKVPEVSDKSYASFVRPIRAFSPR